jgi:hypothetical protein
MLKQCRECHHEVSEQAATCPHCGAPFPARMSWDGFGFEYKSRTSLVGLPLLHISFKYRPNRTPVPAKGIVAIGQFGIGVINISQFGVGFFSLGQFTIAVYAIAQFAFAYSLVAQIGLYLHHGYGQFVKNLFELMENL